MEHILHVAGYAVVASLGMFVLSGVAVWFWRKVRTAQFWQIPKCQLAALSLGAMVATFAAQKVEPGPVEPGDGGETDAKLVYRCTLDSAAAVANPLKGPSGTCAEASFVPGKIGSALSVPAYSCILNIPFPNGLPAQKGCIEFWAKFDGNKDYFSDRGDPVFFDVKTEDADYKAIRVEYNANNGSGKGGLCGRLMSLALYTDRWYTDQFYSAILPESTIYDWHHYALVWNVDGISAVSGNPVATILVDGVPRTQVDMSGWNKDSFVEAMQKPMVLGMSRFGDYNHGRSAYCIDELRIWDSDVTTFSLEIDESDIRYVDANASAGGDGSDWSHAARTIDEVSRNMNGGTIYVKPGVYGAFAYHEVSNDAEPLRIVATGSLEETVIDGAGNSAIVSLEANLPHELAPSPETPMLRLEGFTVRNMNVRACDQAFDRCVVSNYTSGIAFSSSFRNCLVMANEATGAASLFDGCIFDHCTVVGNRSASNSAVNSVARNSIFWGNAGTDLFGLNATNCCVQGGTWAGESNIAEDPLFVNAEAGDYRLSAGSPCIDVGNTAAAVGDRDLAGNARVLGEYVDIGAYESRPPVVPARLVYYNTLDSTDAAAHPAVGAAGTCTSSATFVDGKAGSALHVPAHSNIATLQLPEGLPPVKGCMEFWAKLPEGKTAYIDGGDPVFLRIHRVADQLRYFTLEFNANNGSGRGGLCSYLWSLVMSPEDFSYTKNYSTYITEGNVSDWHHYAFVWNVDGISSIGGTPRSAVLIDGKAAVTSSEDVSWDKADFLSAMTNSLEVTFSSALMTNGKSAFDIDEFKIWDSDKTEFREVSGFAVHQDVSYVYDGAAHTLQPAVNAQGDETFRYALSEEGPYGEQMPTITDAGTLCIWYEVTAEGETTRASAFVTVAKRPITFTSAGGEKEYDGEPLTAGDVTVTGDFVGEDGFSFAVTGSQTSVGTSDNVFTWTANEGTNPDNYAVTAVFGKLKVTMGAVGDGIEYTIVPGETDAVRITRLAYPDGSDVSLPVTLGGLPVTEIAAGALSGSGVAGVRVPAGVSVAGALFENLANVTNVVFAPGSTVSGGLNFNGCASLRQVVMPASVTELEPHAFLGCWALERVVFAGEPPFGNSTDATAKTALLTASVRPASLLQMADAICYPADCAAKWEKSLRNLGYGGRYGAYEGEWTGSNELVPGSGNSNQNPGGTAASGELAAHYAAQTGAASGTVMSGAAGWDMFGVPDGMTWDAATGTLGGAPKRSGSYDVILVSGSGADTRMMRTTIDVAGYAVTTGYVGTAFKVSGAPWNTLASYKTAPAGLKWKSKVLSGVPTKAGTTTYKTKDGEPVKVTILALPEGVKNATFNGILQDAAGKRYPLKVSATAAGKLTATVTKGTKGYALSAAKWGKVGTELVDGAPHRMFTATLTASGLSLTVKVDADAAWNADALTAVGTLGAMKNLVGTAQRNAFASAPAAKETAAARAGTFSLVAASDGAGGWTLAPPEEGAKGPLSLVLKANGAATLTGTLPNKSKVSAAATLHVDAEGAAAVRFYVKGAWIVWLPPAN